MTVSRRRAGKRSRIAARAAARASDAAETVTNPLEAVRDASPAVAVGSAANKASSDLSVLENPLLRAAAAVSTPIIARSAALADAAQPFPTAASRHETVAAYRDAAATRVCVPDLYASGDGGGGGCDVGVSVSAAERVQFARTLSVYNPAAGGLAVIDGAGRRGFAAQQLDALPPPSSVAASALPAGWRIRYSRTKRAAYYFHDATGASSWSLPADALSAPASEEVAAAAPAAATTEAVVVATPEAAAWAAEAACPPLPFDVVAAWSQRKQRLFFTGADGVATWARPLPAAFGAAVAAEPSSVAAGASVAAALAEAAAEGAPITEAASSAEAAVTPEAAAEEAPVETAEAAAAPEAVAEEAPEETAEVAAAKASVEAAPVEAFDDAGPAEAASAQALAEVHTLAPTARRLRRGRRRRASARRLAAADAVAAAIAATAVAEDEDDLSEL